MFTNQAVIVTGSYGAGHNSAANQIQVRMTGAGWRVSVLDIADFYPIGLGHLLRYAYFKQLQLAPGTWGSLLRALDSDAGPSSAGRRACALTGQLPSARLAAAIGPGTDLVISTHPFASQALGLLRRQGTLAVPAVTYLTDASVHPLWVHPDIDVHLALFDEAARQARILGVHDVRTIEPLTPRVPPAHGREAEMLRSTLGLAPTARVALISSGSEGAGDVRRAARDIRDHAMATPVVLCGHNERLRRKVEREPGIGALGWLEGLTEVIRGADCLVQNSGGFTSLEALALGTPLISYRPLPGHGETSAAALAREGLAPWPQTLSELAAAIDDAVLHPVSQVTRPWSARTGLLDALPVSMPLALAS